MTKETIKARALPTHIDAIKATGKERLVSDSVTANLYLKVSAKGKKSWLWQSVIAGKTVKRPIGKWPLMPLADARGAADELNLERQSGEVAKPLNFEAIANDWLADKRAAKKATRTIHEYQRALNKSINPIIGAKLIKDISRRDIDEIINGFRDQGKLVMSNRINGIISQIFDWAMRRDLVAKNPTTHITQYDEGQHLDDLAAFTVSEMAMLYIAAGDLCDDERDALRLIMLCGVRRNEAFCAARSDFDGTTWTLPMPQETRDNGVTYPISHTKNGRPHPMRLPSMAKAIFEASERTYLFTDLEEPHCTLMRNTNINLRQAARKRWPNVPAFQDDFGAHDLRKGFRTALVSDEMFEAGHDFSITDAEIALNHRQSKLVRTYSSARYAAKIGRMLEAWEGLLRQELDALDNGEMKRAA